jgi:hypothetical protein
MLDSTDNHVHNTLPSKRHAKGAIGTSRQIEFLQTMGVRGLLSSKGVALPFGTNAIYLELIAIAVEMQWTQRRLRPLQEKGRQMCPVRA